MNNKFILGFLVAVLATALVANLAIAAELDVGTPTVSVDDMSVGTTHNVSVVAGETYPVEVRFTMSATADEASDVEISAWIQGERNDRVDIEFEDLLPGQRYVARLSVTIPEDLDETEEQLTLYLRIESDEGNWEDEYTLYAQRQSDNLEFLLIDMDDEARAGETIPVTVVLKNMGRQDAEDTFVTVKVPELGISRSAYFEDLFPVDGTGDDDDDEDAREKRIFLTIPESADVGSYEVEVTAYTDETESTVVKALEVIDAMVEGNVIASPSSQTFAVGEEVVYELVLVNSGEEITVYNLVPQGSDALSISLSNSFVTVPSGSSRTVDVYVKANREGTFNFAVDATSDSFTETAQYSATAEGRSFGGVAGNNVVALTIVLAIVFIVLVIILAVLLTRKPERTEEFGESYY